MKAVIPVAGKSTRTYPITVDLPKAMVKLCGKTFLEHGLDTLKGLADEVILVVGFQKEVIMETIGKEYNGIKITYAEQKEQLGTAHALLSAEPFIGMEDFMVLMGDDLYSRDDIKELLRKSPSILAKQVDNPQAFGVWEQENGNVCGFSEKSENPKSDLANTGAYVLSPSIFSFIKKLKKTERGEYELNEAVCSMSREKPVRIIPVKGTWIPVGYPWNFLEANVHILSNMKARQGGEIEGGVTIKGKVSVGKGTIVKSGTYIEGPVYIGENCTIGPNAYIRPDTSIGDNCNVRAEVYDSIIGDNTTAKHACYIGHSVIGRDANIAVDTLTTDYRHDGKNNFTLIKGKKIDTGRRKLGAFIGERVCTGAGTIIYPGRKIWPGKTTLPGEIVKKDTE